MSTTNFTLFNERTLSHTNTSYRRHSDAAALARRRLARFLEIASANDAPDQAREETVVLDFEQHYASRG